MRGKFYLSIDEIQKAGWVSIRLFLFCCGCEVGRPHIWDLTYEIAY